MSCAVCGKVADLMCQRCGEPYCQDVCQRTDWQRHKYFCIIMPPLISARPLNKTSDANQEKSPSTSVADDAVKPSSLEGSMSNCIIKGTPDDVLIIPNDSSSAVVKPKPQPETIVKFSSAWRSNVSPPENEFFECCITYVDQNDGGIWVIESLHAERLERLNHNIKRCMQQKKACRIEDIVVGDLVCVSVEQNMYRGEIMELQPNLSCAQVRLIDMGCVATIDGKDIYLAVPHMAESKAYAFKVMLAQNVQDLHINKTISLRLLGAKNPDGILLAAVKDTSALLELPLQVLANKPDIKLLKTLQTSCERKEPQVAMVQIKELNELNNLLSCVLTEDNATYQFNKQLADIKRPFFLAARTKQGYRRAFLIDFIEEPAKYLIYEMDEGCFSIVDEVRRIPSELLAFPMRSFAILLPKGESVALPQFKDLSIEFDNANDEESGTWATLSAHNKKLCTVRAVSFTGQITKELSCKYFNEPIENDDVVYITRVVSYHEICISSVKTKEYLEIFKDLMTKCAEFSNESEIEFASIVLVLCPHRGPYRAEVVSKMDDERYRVLNIDTGNHHLVPFRFLRRSCEFLEHLPVSLCRSSIKTICNIPSTAVPSNTTALYLLMKLYEKKSEMIVKFCDDKRSTLDLMDLNVEPPSLMTRLLPMMFTAHAVELQPAKNLPVSRVIAPEVIKSAQCMGFPISALPPLPPSPPSTPTLEANAKHIKRHYFKDIKHELLPFNVEISLMILSAVDMQNTGYVTGCYFQDEKAAEDYQNLLNLVAEVGLTDTSLLPGYVPDIGEMCLAIFSEDNSWYRGVCLRVSGNNAHILFCDYGNMEIVAIKNIKPITANLVKSTLATKCFIDGFNKSGNFKILEDYLMAKNKITCIASCGTEPNTCVIRIPTLNKILSKKLV